MYVIHTTFPLVLSAAVLISNKFLIIIKVVTSIAGCEPQMSIECSPTPWNVEYLPIGEKNYTLSRKKKRFK